MYTEVLIDAPDFWWGIDQTITLFTLYRNNTISKHYYEECNFFLDFWIFFMVFYMVLYGGLRGLGDIIYEGLGFVKGFPQENDYES